ncbi:Uncharacterised protein [Cedecea neteri]|uniref:DNA utilization protein HofO C-terminal domain-containing protein n=1 Tax=Cedecea neteri TaxID=158822 RepID=A0A291DSV8_9ENTR|nr:hypothetical protein [Cedecea neteri]ATF90726.1 hypothetical protein CO704_00815 [Cedecea neteri]SQA99008.1 Uncharacterised protein [Cedecea neteri]
MLNNLERLIDGHVAYRVLGLLGGLFAVALICLWLWVWPLRQQLQAKEQHNQQRWQHVLSLQRQIAALPKPEPLPDVVPLETFSAMAAVKRTGGRLVKWQPDPRHSVLEVLLPWPRVPPFFRELSGYGGLKLPAFILSEAGEQVRVLVTLEFTDESR